MAALILPSRRVWQPQGPVGLDFSNPLSRGLIAAVSSHGPVTLNHVTQQIADLTSAAPFEASRLGFARKHTATSYETASVSGISAMSEITVFYESYAIASVNEFGGPIEIGGGINTQQTARFEHANRLYFSVWDDSGVRINIENVENAGILASSVTGKFGLISRPGSFVGYKNGVSVAVGSGPSGIRVPTKFIIGANWDTSFQGFVNPLLVWRRALTTSEFQAVNENPWQLFRPIQRRIMVAVSSGGTETSLTVAEASHGHTSDSLSLTTATALTTAESSHAHTADGLTLSTGAALVVAEASHAHTADALTLSTGTSLAIGDALHSHTADAPALTTNSALAVADASHGHTAENLTLSAFTGDTLAMQGATHAHSAETAALTTDQHLAVGDAAHAHAADALALSTQILLTVSDAAHAHSVDNITLSNVPALVIASVMHAHAADSVALTSQSWLAAQDALHAHQADNLSLSAFDADDDLYPLAGLTQEWPRAGSQTFPLAGLRQNFPLE